MKILQATCKFYAEGNARGRVCCVQSGAAFVRARCPHTARSDGTSSRAAAPSFRGWTILRTREDVRM